MNALIRKEIRALLPAWLATLLLGVVPTCLYAIKARSFWSDNAFATQQGFIILSGYCFGLGAIVLALTPFGHEFTAKTFSHLLSQPATRQRMWVAKALPLAVATLLNLIVYLGSLWLVLHWFGVTWDFLSDIHDMFRAVPIVALLAYSGGLWTTVLFRTIPGALGITIVAPLAVLMLENRIVGKVAPHYVDTLAPWFLVVYAIAGIIFARWYFLRAQDVPWTGGPVLIPEAVGNRFAQTFSFRRSGPYLAFIRKELQLQQVSFLIAALVLVCHLGTFLVRCLHPQNITSTVWIVINNIWIVWFALPLFIGSTPVAEERRLGTLESLLTQPIPCRAQFLIKFLITVALAIFFGAIVPWTLEQGWNRFGPHSELMFATSFDGLLATAIVIASCTFFASTISRQTIEALCLGGVLTPIAYAMVQFLAINPKTGDTVPRFGFLTFYIFVPVCLSTVVYLAWKNYQRTHLRWTNFAGTFGVLALSIMTAWGIASFTWYRAWELFTPLEPAHGKPVLHIGDRAKITSCPIAPAALLPDGRIWMARHVYRELNHAVVGCSITDPHFLPGTNWMDLAAAHHQFAIRSDGTLWDLTPTHFVTNRVGKRQTEIDPPQQMGSETNWSSLAAASSYAFALKRDGSLWGRGYNGGGQLGPGSKDGYESFTHIWTNMRFSRVFASEIFCYGIQSDGTIYRWGGIYGASTNLIANYQPIKSRLTGTNWISFYGGFPELVLRDDGKLWLMPQTNRVSFQGPVFHSHLTIEDHMCRVGTSSDWCAMTTKDPLSMLKTDGRWFIHDGHYVGKPDWEGVRVSKYADWIAIGTYVGAIGLATDGTISEWVALDHHSIFACQSRAPAWSANVFATTSNHGVAIGSTSIGMK